MERIDRLRRLFEYDDWANREVVGALAKAGEAPKRSLGVMAHIVGAELLWLDRMRGQKAKVAVWPELSLERCRAELTELEKSLDDFLDDLAPADLDREVTYVNSKGESWSSTLNDILSHVLFHSAYHRGQIASDLRAAGLEPAYTDFIHAARTGALDRERPPTARA